MNKLLSNVTPGLTYVLDNEWLLAVYIKQTYSVFVLTLLVDGKDPTNQTLSLL